MVYDPRGLSHSTLDVLPEDQRIVEIFADDAHRLLASVRSEPAFVFGNSGGAIIGLELVTQHAQQVQTLVAHEPPAAALLPGGPAIGPAMQGVYDTYRREGISPALQTITGYQPESWTSRARVFFIDSNVLHHQLIDEWAVSATHGGP